MHRMVQLPRALLVAQRVSGGKREAVKIENCVKVSTMRFWWRKKRNRENQKPLEIVSIRESVHSEALLEETIETSTIQQKGVFFGQKSFWAREWEERKGEGWGEDFLAVFFYLCHGTQVKTRVQIS